MERGAATVLVVDNDDEVVAAYRSYLEADYDVRVAFDGEAALEQIDEDVDVVLLDRTMPQLPGEAVLEHIREAGYTCQIAMVTGVEPDVDIIEMGFDAYVRKPVSAEELRTTVEGLLERRTYSKKLQDFYTAAETYGKLESAMDSDQLEANEEVSALRERLDHLHEEVGDAVTQLDRQEGFDVAIRSWVHRS